MTSRLIVGFYALASPGSNDIFQGQTTSDVIRIELTEAVKSLIYINKLNYYNLHVTMPSKCQCGKQSTFNLRGEKKPIWCASCPNKHPEAVDVVNKRCSCGKVPHFNLPGERKGKWCASCPDRHPDAVNVIDRKCSCGKRPNFNLPGERKGKWCVSCPDKHPDAIDVEHKRCPCGKRPKFNLPGERNGKWCVSCPDKPPDAIDVEHERCTCGKIPSLNLPDERKGKWCASCPDKHPDAVNVIDKKCPCGKKPSFNLPGYTHAIWCNSCPEKSVYAINIRYNICCGEDDSGCPNSRYVMNGHTYCIECDPNKARQRKRYKRYEESFFEYIKDKIDIFKREYKVTFEPNDNGRKSASIDGIVLGNDIIICIEVDENKHIYYEDDNIRMKLATNVLTKGFPSHSIAWVRVNPTIIESKNQWSKNSIKIRHRRFEDVVTIVNELSTHPEHCIKYVGF